MPNISEFKCLIQTGQRVSELKANLQARQTYHRKHNRKNGICQKSPYDDCHMGMLELDQQAFWGMGSRTPNRANDLAP